MSDDRHEAAVSCELAAAADAAAGRAATVIVAVVTDIGVVNALYHRTINDKSEPSSLHLFRFAVARCLFSVA